jgi:putative transposase
LLDPKVTWFVHCLTIMPRIRRLQIAGLTQHVIQRGNNRSDIFKCAGDYAVFLSVLREAAARHQLEIHSYALMTNHFHLLATPQTASALAKTMQSVGLRYVYHFNSRYARTGTLFEGRYRSVLIDTESYWFNCMRYVELNPVRAGLVSTPEAYAWSSYASNALGMPDQLIVPHTLYELLGDSPPARQQTWREICGQAFAEGQLEEIRHAVHYGHPLGNVRALLVAASA